MLTVASGVRGQRGILQEDIRVRKDGIGVGVLAIRLAGTVINVQMGGLAEMQPHGEVGFSRRSRAGRASLRPRRVLADRPLVRERLGAGQRAHVNVGVVMGRGAVEDGDIYLARSGGVVRSIVGRVET